MGKFSFFFLIVLIGLTDCQAAGIQIGRTRVVYDASNKEVALALKNKETELPWLVQSWTDTGDEKTRGPFIVTPPLFRLDPQKEQSLRITWTGAPLPTDKESLFYINVRTIPATEKSDEHKNTLRLIYKTRLKLFWRPEGLEGSPDQTCQDLKFILQNHNLKIINNGAFYSVFDNLHVGSTVLKKADSIGPKSTITLPLENANARGNVTWRCITDYGNASAQHTATPGEE